MRDKVEVHGRIETECNFCHKKEMCLHFTDELKRSRLYCFECFDRWYIEKNRVKTKWLKELGKK